MKRYVKAEKAKDGYYVTLSETHIAHDLTDVKRIAGYFGVPNEDIVFTNFPSDG